MRGGLPVERNIRAEDAQHLGEPLRMAARDDGVVLAGADVHPSALERNRLVGDEGYHWPEEDRAGKHAGRREKDAPRDVGAVRESDGHDLRGVETVLRRGAIDERDEILRTSVEILDVENTLGEPAEKACGAILENVATRAQQSRIGGEHLAQVDEIILVAARAVEQEQRSWVVPVRWEITVDVRQLASFHRHLI